VDILADRAFASAYEFGAFSSGKLGGALGAVAPVRLVEPTKFYNANPKHGDGPATAPDWELGTVKLWQKDIKSLPGIMKFLGDFIAQSRSANVEVPVAHLAFFEANGAFLPLSESPANAKIQATSAGIAKLERQIGTAHAAYQALVPGTKLKVRDQKKWLNKRAGNRALKGETPEMHALWVKGQKLKASLEQARRSLAKVKKRLRFYTSSISPAEREVLQSGGARAQRALVRRLAQACYEYHQRWAIENFFEQFKRDILHLGKTRRVNWLRQQWLQAQAIYNAYIIARTLAIAAGKRKRGPRWKPFDAKVKTRKKRLRAADYRLLSFNQFIGDIAQRCLVDQLRKAFTQC
jgi:hypothetical protein